MAKKIRMLHDRSGGRYDGQAWPVRGGVFEVPDEEADALVEHGIAEHVEAVKPARARASKAAPA